MFGLGWGTQLAPHVITHRATATRPLLEWNAFSTPQRRGKRELVRMTHPCEPNPSPPPPRAPAPAAILGHCWSFPFVPRLDSITGLITLPPSPNTPSPGHRAAMSSTAPQATAQAPDPVLSAVGAPSQGRKRPFRTYGRRSVQEKAQQREAPQPRTNGRVADEAPNSAQTASPTRSPPLPEKEQAKPRGRGSITAYFKPLPISPGPDKPSPAETCTHPVSSPSPPPTYPSPPSRSRKRRRLTTRPQFSSPDRQSSRGSDDGVAVIDTPAVKTMPCAPCSPSTRTTTPPVNSGLDDTPRPAFGRLGASTVNIQDRLADPPERSRGAATEKPPEKRPPREMTQTTLSLSVQKEPGFTICGVCDLLYNPLNEKDRKEHNRRHAAFSRNKKKVA